MILRFMFSGSLVAEQISDTVPAIGTECTIRFQHGKKGYEPGTVVSFKVGPEFPPVYDFTHGEPIVYLDVADFEVVTMVGRSD